MIDTDRQKHQMEILVGYILLSGVLLSAVCLSLGILWRWIDTGSPRLEYQIFGENLFQFILDGVRQAMAGNFRPRLMVNLGIALLLLTPFVRVAASMIYFAFVERNVKYSLFTAFVLAVLSCSLFLR